MSNASLLTKIPTNTSLLQSARFTFSFPNLPFLKYFCQTIQLPGVSTSAVQVVSPFADTFRHGDKLVYDQFTVQALIDEDLRVWEETYNWLRALTKPQDFPQYRNRENNTLYHDAILTINSNANIPNIRIAFKNCHPMSLSNIQFSTVHNADSIITADISFRYDYFTIERFMEI